MANQGFTHQIKNNGDGGRSFEDYSSLHKYASRNGSKKFREYMANCQPTATDGAGTPKAVASSTAVTQIGKTELTLVLAADTDDIAYDFESVIVHYITAAGVKKTCSAAYNVANSTTEVAFTDINTGLIAVIDFYCFNQEDYADGLCVVSSIAAEAGDNICIGITGVVAGIADAEICFAHINTLKTSPLLADIYGVGSIYGERESDDAADDDLEQELYYVTPWGDIKEAFCTNTTTHTDIIRYVDENGVFVCDFYHIRELETTQTLVKAHHLCNDDGTKHHAVIEALAHTSCHTSFYALGSDKESYIGKIYVGWSINNNTVTIKVTYTPYGDATPHTRIRTLSYFDSGIDINERLAPLSLVTMTIEDGGAAGIATIEAMYLDVLA